MTKYINIIGIVAFFILGLFSLVFCEDITITTYYPSPYGSYNELTTTGNTYLATEGGNVGIGTTSPNVKLDVVGNLSGSSERILSVRNSSGATLASITANRGGGDGELLLFDWSSGQASANTVQISASGNSYFMGGNVSIGSWSVPSARLTVGGQIKITDGTQDTGKVLTSDASGVASWQTAGGLSSCRVCVKVCDAGSSESSCGNVQCSGYSSGDVEQWTPLAGDSDWYDPDSIRISIQCR